MLTFNALFLAAVMFGRAPVSIVAEEAPATHGVFIADDPAQSGEMHIIKLNDPNVDWVAAPQEGAPAEGPAPNVIRIRTAAPANVEAGGPWLGIQFGPVSKPLVAHLGLSADSGQMVLNVLKGSPADTAGIQQYDVITHLDGQPTSGDIGEFLDRVRALTPNQAITLSVRRAGQSMQLGLRVGARPADDAAPELKYESPVEELAGGRVFGRSGMLQKDDQGNWTFKGFNLQDLPNVWNAIPDVSDLDFQIAVPGPMGPGGDRVFIQKSLGEEIRISKDDDGQITISRTKDEDGNSTTTTNTYANLEEFKAKEPDLAHRFTTDDSGGFSVFFGSGAGPAEGFEKKFNLLWKQNGDGQDLADLHEKLMTLHGHGQGQGQGLFLARPRTSFQTTPDGKIQVKVRDGEDELVTVYDNAAALEAARPNLYKKYQKLQEHAAP